MTDHESPSSGTYYEFQPGIYSDEAAMGKGIPIQRHVDMIVVDGEDVGFLDIDDDGYIQGWVLNYDGSATQISMVHADTLLSAQEVLVQHVIKRYQLLNNG